MAIFRSQLQGELLARVLLAPGSPTISDLARDLGAPVPTVQREVSRLEAAGVLSSSRVGRARLVAADESNPVLDPLRQLVLVAFGPRYVLAEELRAVDGVEDAYLFGSWAARYEGEEGRPPGDVDALIVGSPDRDALFEACQRAGVRLRREVDATVVSTERWAAATEPFLQEIRRRPLVQLQIEGRNVA